MSRITIDVKPSVKEAQDVQVEQSARPAIEPTDALAVDTVFELEDVSLHYGAFRAVRDISIAIPRHQITALIGPSGCGKSTVLRSLNRMNELIPGARISGTIRYNGEDIYDPRVDAVEVRRRIGMVFQKPNPFP
jgi:phosphate transport system ATP-binding protein